MKYYDASIYDKSYFSKCDTLVNKIIRLFNIIVEHTCSCYIIDAKQYSAFVLCTLHASLCDAASMGSSFR